MEMLGSGYFYDQLTSNASCNHSLLSSVSLCVVLKCSDDGFIKGNPLSPVIAEILTDEKIHKQLFINRFIYRYGDRDDIIVYL